MKNQLKLIFTHVLLVFLTCAIVFRKAFRTLIFVSFNLFNILLLDLSLATRNIPLQCFVIFTGCLRNFASCIKSSSWFINVFTDLLQNTQLDSGIQACSQPSLIFQTNSCSIISLHFHIMDVAVYVMHLLGYSYNWLKIVFVVFWYGMCSWGSKC